jgi:hypothetical protein
MTDQQALPGRVENLTDEQEHVLKQVWMYILHFSGYNIKPPGPLIRTSSIKSNATTSSDKKDKKKSGLFGKLKRGNKHKEKEEHEIALARTLSNQSAIDPNVKHSTDLKVHEALRSLDSSKTLDAFWKIIRQDAPDNLILRFVRARKWDVDNSLLMLSSSIEWRMKESKVDDVLLSGELACLEKKQMGVIKQFQSGKCIIRGRDKKGRPIVIVRPRFHHSSEQNFEEIEIFTLLLIEYARLMLNEPTDQCTLIFDLHGFTMANMDYEPVKYMIKAFEAHYPESLGILLIHRAPWIFNGIWQIVKNWLDPVVASKINFTKNTSDLEKYIEKSELFGELGGDDELEYEYLEPTKKENGLAVNDAEIINKYAEERNKLQEEFINKTIEWIEATDITTSKQLLHERIAISKKLTDNFKTYDGCVRNRGLYDRLGVIRFQQ